MEENSLEKFIDDMDFWCLIRCGVGFVWVLILVFLGLSGKFKGVWGLELLLFERLLRDLLFGDFLGMGDWFKDWFLDFCGEERDKGMIKLVEDWELIEILFIFDWFWLRVLWDVDSYG